MFSWSWHIESLKTTLGHGFESHHLHRYPGGGLMLPPAFCFQGLQFKITCHNYSLSAHLFNRAWESWSAMIVQLRDASEKDIQVHPGASFAFVVRLALPPTSNAMRETRTPERKGRDRWWGISECGHFLQVHGKDRTDGSSKGHPWFERNEQKVRYESVKWAKKWRKQK